MSALVETYRGVVLASECDVFGHLNIAYYVDRFADAAADFLARAGGPGWRTLALETRYEREYRAGEGIVIRSGLIAAERASLRLGHEAVNGATGERTTLAEHVLAPLEGEVPALAAAFDAWQPPLFAPLELPAGAGTIPSGRDRVKASEAEERRLSLLGILQRCSGACMHVIDAIGMDDAYRRDANRGFSTIETRLALAAAPRLGEGVVVASDILAVGTSSLRMLHRMRGAADGRELAQFYQAGVQLDLAARRPAPWPAALRDKAAALRIA